MTAPEARADADHTALEALNEEEALRVAMARCMFGRQNSSIWQVNVGTVFALHLAFASTLRVMDPEHISSNTDT
jgi:hypothetical protein